MGERVTNPASALSPDFDQARVGALSGTERCLAVLGGRLFAVGDRHSGRWLYELRPGGWQRHVPAGEWLHHIESGDAELRAWSGDPVSGDVLRGAGYSGRAWTERDIPGQPGHLGVLHPQEPFAYRERRAYPGMSVCEVSDTRSGEVVARWRAPTAGLPAWEDDTLWLRYEAWPRQELVGWSLRSRQVTQRLPLPVGALANLIAAPGRAAAVWADPYTPTSVIAADSVPELAAELNAFSPGFADRPYTVSTVFVEDACAVVHTPPGDPIGRIMMLHGGPHSAVWPVYSPLVAFLCRLGWEVLAVNPRSSSLGSRFSPNACRYGVDDALDVARLAEARDDGLPLVLAGWSYGAYLAGRAIGAGVRCAGLVALSGFLTPETLEASSHPAVKAFREARPLPGPDLDALAAVPLLAVHGRADDRIPLAAIRAEGTGHPAHTLLELPGEGHGIVTDEGAARAYAGLAAWLTERRPGR
ncbi:alpha/beta hydrolase family protein [Nonomuraea sp. NPDC050783]|uniref:alpha/beta hydrolase family protein n=1 Tax=Nonomuraea sp. NPDC050783 TaxID=3154634 RepID=UPI003466D4EB